MDAQFSKSLPSADVRGSVGSKSLVRFKLSRREELLVRLLRSAPLSLNLRTVLAVRASSAGFFVALSVLRALEGDAVAVIGTFLKVRMRMLLTIPDKHNAFTLPILRRLHRVMITT